MKKKLFTLMAGTAVAFSALTGCTNIKMPGQNSGQNTGTNQTTQNDGGQNNNDQTNQETDKINLIINNSLDLLERKLSEPMIHADFGVRVDQTLGGSTKEVTTTYDNYTGAFVSKGEKAPVATTRSSNVTLDAHANIDNLYYVAAAKNNTENLRNRTTFRYDVTSIDNKDGTEEYRDFQSMYIGNNQAYTSNDPNAPYTPIADMAAFNQQTGDILNRVYLAASLDFDITVETVARLVKLAALTSQGGPMMAYAEVADLVDKTIDFINQDMFSEDYLNYVCTRHLALDVDSFTEEDKAAIITILSSMQTVNTDSIFTITEETSQVTVELNYLNLKDSLELCLSAVSTLENYLETTLNNFAIDGLTDAVTDVFNNLPTDLSFIRTFNTKRDCITSYTVDLNVNGKVGGAASNGETIQSGNNITYVTYETTYDKLDAHFAISCNFLDTDSEVFVPRLG